MVKKYKKNGMVAVLYSPGYGAGWSTWTCKDEEIEFLLFDKKLARLVEAGDLAAAEKYVTSIHPDVYTGGAKDLRIEWLPEGTHFRVEEYDGSERIVLLGNICHIA